MPDSTIGASTLPSAFTGSKPQIRSGDGPRFAEPSKWIPVFFVFVLISTLYCIYVFCHIVRLLQFGVPLELQDQAAIQRGQIQFVGFHIITVLLVLCYAQSVAVHPGTIPDHPEWIFDARAAKAGEVPQNEVSLTETKRTGDRRHCKWCGKYKPDRCHHCRVCRICILKMDHHCPWIYNCVGFHNHKYFFLLLLYTCLDCQIIAWTMVESVQASIEGDTSFFTMFFLLFGTTLASFLGMLVTCFFSFHIWLMLKAMTTIDFCEKSLKRVGYNSSVYDRGFTDNIRAVLGPNPIFWLLPVDPPRGTGLTFVTENTRLLGGSESGKTDRKKGHNPAQRQADSPSSQHLPAVDWDSDVEANARKKPHDLHPSPMHSQSIPETPGRASPQSASEKLPTDGWPASPRSSIVSEKLPSDGWPASPRRESASDDKAIERAMEDKLKEHLEEIKQERKKREAGWADFKEEHQQSAADAKDGSGGKDSVA